jgi:hypothetical protein
MPQYDVAHIREQCIDLIIIPLDGAYHYKSTQDQQAVISQLQSKAESAGLAGTVVPVWEHGGSWSFIAPPNWHAFFKSITKDFIRANINKSLSW